MYLVHQVWGAHMWVLIMILSPPARTPCSAQCNLTPRFACCLALLQANKTMHDPATQDYWTQCGGRPCLGSWGSPAGTTAKYWMNYSNPAFVSW